MVKNMNIAIYGGAFNPPTLAHKKIIKKLSEEFEKILIIPSYHHPVKGILEHFDFRTELLNDLITSTKQTNIDILNIEKDIFSKLNRTIYSIDLIKEIKLIYPNSILNFVLGEDHKSLSLFNKDHINEMKSIGTKFHFVSNIENIRSTFVREAILKKECIKHLTTNEISQKILKSGIYDGKL